jgi:hypothetical protein
MERHIFRVSLIIEGATEKVYNTTEVHLQQKVLIWCTNLLNKVES